MIEPCRYLKSEIGFQCKTPFPIETPARQTLYVGDSLADAETADRQEWPSPRASLG